MPAIKNFGYLWDRDRVFWGHQKVTGTLLGHRSGFGDVDFREQKGVYILHSVDLKVVYVGQVGSGNDSLFDRLKSHSNSDKLWNRWRYFSWFGWRKVNKGNHRLAAYGGGSPHVSGASEEFLDEIEAVLIQVVEPPLNRQGSKWKGTLQFQQADDKRLKHSDLQSIAVRQAEIGEQVSELAKQIDEI
jgi:hypothetical protein